MSVPGLINSRCLCALQAALSNAIPESNGMRCVPDGAMDGISHNQCHWKHVPGIV